VREAFDFVRGFGNALASNESMGLEFDIPGTGYGFGRIQGGSDYLQAGQAFGDAATLIIALPETGAGMGLMFGGGAAITAGAATGPGEAVVAPPAVGTIAAGAALTTHGAVSGSLALEHLNKYMSSGSSSTSGSGAGNTGGGGSGSGASTGAPKEKGAKPKVAKEPSATSTTTKSEFEAPKTSGPDAQKDAADLDATASSPPLKEGDVMKAREYKARREKGSTLRGHHVPQAKRLEQRGIDPDEGTVVVLENKKLGSSGEQLGHTGTRSFGGRGSKLAEAEKDLPLSKSEACCLQDPPVKALGPDVAQKIQELNRAGKYGEQFLKE